MLYTDDGATLDDLREAVASLEDLERTARRVLGAAHPLASGIENELREARAAHSAPARRHRRRQGVPKSQYHQN